MDEATQPGNMRLDFVNIVSWSRSPDRHFTEPCPAHTGNACTVPPPAVRMLQTFKNSTQNATWHIKAAKATQHERESMMRVLRYCGNICNTRIWAIHTGYSLNVHSWSCVKVFMFYLLNKEWQKFEGLLGFARIIVEEGVSYYFMYNYKLHLQGILYSFSCEFFIIFPIKEQRQLKRVFGFC